MRTIAICNVALTVPARIVVGMVLDRFGPRITYSCLLIYAAFPCLAFALAQNFEQMVYSRLALSIVGCGFVIGIRMVAEWFEENEIGLAEGIYGGWGNFGSAGAALTLPSIAAALAFLGAGQVNWRLAIALTGIAAACYGVIYYFSVTDTPPGKVYQRPPSSAGMEVTSQREFWFLLATNIPLVGALGVIAWRLTKVNFITTQTLAVIGVLLVGLYLFQAYNIWQASKPLMTGAKCYAPADRYKFSQVFNLELAYVATFGSELAVVSMLPTYFERGFGLIALVFPQTLFFGEREIETIIETGSTFGVTMLLLIGLAKMLAISCTLHSGFRGGFIFPLFYIGAAVGLAIALGFPQVHPTVGMVCMMAAVNVAITKTPISTTVILSVLSDTAMVPVIAIASLTSFLLTINLNMIKTQRSRSVSESKSHPALVSGPPEPAASQL